MFQSIPKTANKDSHVDLRFMSGRSWGPDGTYEQLVEQLMKVSSIPFEAPKDWKNKSALRRFAIAKEAAAVAKEGIALAPPWQHQNRHLEVTRHHRCYHYVTMGCLSSGKKLWKKHAALQVERFQRLWLSLFADEFVESREFVGASLGLVEAEFLAAATWNRVMVTMVTSGKSSRMADVIFCCTSFWIIVILHRDSCGTIAIKTP